MGIAWVGILPRQGVWLSSFFVVLTSIHYIKTSALHLTNWVKLPFSDFVSLFQVCPRNGIFCWPKTTTTSMMRRIFFLFWLTFSSDYYEIGAYISFLSFDIMFLKLIALLVASWWFRDSPCDTNIPLFRPVAFFQSINPNPVKTSFLSMGEPKAKQLIQNPTSLWFEQRSYDNFSSHFAEYLLPSVPGKIVPRLDCLMSNSSVLFYHCQTRMYQKRTKDR